MKAILLAAIGVTIALMVLRERPPSDPQPVAKPAPPAVIPPAPPKQVEAPRQAAQPRPAPKPLAAPVAAKSELKRIPPAPQAPIIAVKIAEPPVVIPAAAPAAAAVERVAAQPPAPEPGPDSVFGWGPWSGGGAAYAGGSGANVPPQDAVARAQGAIQSVSFAPAEQPASASSQPNVPALTSVSAPHFIPPPQTVKPGHGGGDKNHLHVHRHHQDHHRGRDR